MSDKNFEKYNLFLAFVRGEQIELHDLKKINGNKAKVIFSILYNITFDIYEGTYDDYCKYKKKLRDNYNYLKNLNLLY